MKKKAKAILKAMAVILILVLIVLGVQIYTKEKSKQEEIQKIELEAQQKIETAKQNIINSKLDFALNDKTNTTYHLSDYAGKKIVILYWMQWCPPCRRDLEMYENVYQELGENREDVILLSITKPINEKTTNKKDISEEEIIKYIEEKKYTFPVLIDKESKVFEQYNIMAYPTILIINKNGEVDYKETEKTYKKEELLGIIKNIM